MALSEHEQRLLEEMERGLYASEADSVPTSRGERSTPSYRAIVVGAVLAVVGVGLLIGGVASSLTWLGLIGFVVMLAGVLYIFSPSNQVITGAAVKPQSNESLTQRAERRWSERLDGDR